RRYLYKVSTAQRSYRRY
ncbi:hypothetical protein, partial [Pantoea septica]